jgi:hypothetical protein
MGSIAPQLAAHHLRPARSMRYRVRKALTCWIGTARAPCVAVKAMRPVQVRSNLSADRACTGTSARNPPTRSNSAIRIIAFVRTPLGIKAIDVAPSSLRVSSANHDSAFRPSWSNARSGVRLFLPSWSRSRGRDRVAQVDRRLSSARGRDSFGFGRWANA